MKPKEILTHLTKAHTLGNSVKPTLTALEAALGQRWWELVARGAPPIHTSVVDKARYEVGILFFLVNRIVEDLNIAIHQQLGLVDDHQWRWLTNTDGRKHQGLLSMLKGHIKRLNEAITSSDTTRMFEQDNALRLVMFRTDFRTPIEETTKAGDRAAEASATYLAAQPKVAMFAARLTACIEQITQQVVAVSAALSKVHEHGLLSSLSPESQLTSWVSGGMRTVQSMKEAIAPIPHVAAEIAVAESCAELDAAEQAARQLVKDLQDNVLLANELLGQLVGSSTH